MHIKIDGQTEGEHNSHQMVLITFIGLCSCFHIVKISQQNQQMIFTFHNIYRNKCFKLKLYENIQLYSDLYHQGPN